VTKQMIQIGLEKVVHELQLKQLN